MSDQCVSIDGPRKTGDRELGDGQNTAKCRGMERRSRGRLLVLAITLGLASLTFVHAPYPEELLLQQAPTLVAVAALTALTLSRSLSQVSFNCMIAFLWIHIFGARWIYSFVPYDLWCETISGQTLSESFGWERNHYDRLVHFASGLLGVPPASEVLQRTTGLKPLAAAVLSVSLVMTVGALYEILEWQLAVWLSPAQAEAYNGQQGDMWDPQKDLLMAWNRQSHVSDCFPAMDSLFSAWLGTRGAASAGVISGAERGEKGGCRRSNRSLGNHLPG